MAKRVLDVGQCGFDHGQIRKLIESHFGAEVIQAHDAEGALAELRNGEYNLVLINRKLDGNGSDGFDVLKSIKADEALAEIPVMLVTNYPEHQAAAVAAGGTRGFGKAELDSAETLERLRATLG